jgi:hypothetical protein
MELLDSARTTMNMANPPIHGTSRSTIRLEVFKLVSEAKIAKRMRASLGVTLKKERSSKFTTT